MSSLLLQTRHTTRDDARRALEFASLRKLEPFQTLSPMDLERVAAVARFQAVEKRQRIPVPGESSSGLCFLTQGLAKASRLDSNGTETLLYLIKPGEFFGPAVSGARVDVNIVSLQPCVNACVRPSDLEQVVGPVKLMSDISQIRSFRLQQLEERLDELSVGTVPARTARILLRLCREFPSVLACGTAISVLFTQQDIANMTGATREVTSSTLNQFRRRGWLGVHDRHLCVHDADELYQMSICATNG
jgi:CRP/FNR family transcriptional regulator